MSRVKALLSSGIGRKVLMGVTGLAMIGFLITHVLANLTVLIDPDAYNHYSHALISNPLIYIAEAGLFLLFVSHFFTGIALTRSNRAARPEAYAVKGSAGAPSRKSLASSTMILSGIALLVFVPLHINGMKFGPWYDVAGEPGMRDLAKLVFEKFQHGGWVAFYEICLVLLGFHAFHGFGSAFESLGVAHSTGLRRTGQVLAIVLTLGFMVVPAVVYLGGGAQ